MISDSHLMRLSLAIAVIGIVVLFFLVQLIEPSFVGLSEINEAMSGQAVITNGTVSSFTIKDSNIFLTLDDEINVVMFNVESDSTVYELKINDEIQVEGRVSVYRDELEIIAEKIEKI